MTTEEKLARLLAALNEIVDMPVEDDEWDGAAKYTQCQQIAENALQAIK